ncbi:unnamed protein product [Mytilus coruscus]|uniref:Uncharacterized protein n=1 Tax=Mytilus coruscus TaxID=42192 RepID=A0A6J8EZZ8_MYTCO|nr:unnamed protein product [Mytilus coruscus]
MNETDTPVQRKFTKTDNLNNRSPSSWMSSPLNQEKILAAKKIKVYSKDEISKAYGLRKKKMTFMNGKLREYEYMNDPDIRSCGKHVIMGMAETACDRFNADDAKIVVAEVEVLISKLQQRGKSYTDKQTKTITRLTERLNRGKHEVAASLKRISTLRETENVNSNIVNEEKELVALHCELLKTTEALRKACDVKMKDLKKILDTMEVQNEEEDIVLDVSNESIVGDILKDHAYC